MANKDVKISSEVEFKVGKKSFPMAGEYDSKGNDFSFSYPPPGKLADPRSHMSLNEFLTWAEDPPLESPINTDYLPPELRQIPSVLVKTTRVAKKGKDYDFVVSAELGNWNNSTKKWVPASWEPIPGIPLKLSGFSIEIDLSVRT